MEFKKIEWSGDWRKSACLPFGLEVEVIDRRKNCRWALQNSFYALKSGTRPTMQQAMESAERAYHKYVTENLERC